MEIKAGDIFKGQVNGEIIKIVKVMPQHDTIIYVSQSTGKQFSYGLKAFEHLLVDKIN